MRRLTTSLALLFLVGLGGCDDRRSDTDAGPQAVDGGDDAGMMISGPRPSPRSDFWAVTDTTSGTIAFFGGDDGPIVNQIPQPNFLDETWLFEPGVGWTQITTEPRPSPRGRYAVAYDSVNRRMLVFGGRFRTTGTSGNYTVHNDLWAFGFESRTWTQLHDGAGTAPPGRYFGGMAVGADGNVYVVGGAVNEAPLSIELAQDLWVFDGTNWTEETINGSLTGPTPGRLFVAWAHDTMRDRILAYGGQAGDFVTAANTDLFGFDIATRTWSVLHDGFSGTYPDGRFNAMLTYDAGRDRYLLFGGHGDMIMNNQVWAFDPDGASWSEVRAGDTFTGASLGCNGNSREIPTNFLDQDLTSPQGRMTAGWAVLGDTAWALLGESDCSDHLDDTWSLNLETGMWNEILSARTGESCERRGDDCSCLCL